LLFKIQTLILRVNTYIFLSEYFYWF